MSSSAGQAPNQGHESRVESQVARALEAAKDPFLRKIAERFQKEPNQILKISEILGFINEEEKNAKALIWLKKHEPEKYLAVLQSSKAENKKPEGKKMKVIWGSVRVEKEMKLLAKRYAERLEKKFKKAIAKRKVVLETEVIGVLCGTDQIVGVFLPGASKGLWYDDVHFAWVPKEAKIWARFWHSHAHGFQDLKEGKFTVTIHVREREYLSLAKSVARAYEKSRRKECVTIHKEY